MKGLHEASWGQQSKYTAYFMFLFPAFLITSATGSPSPDFEESLFPVGDILTTYGNRLQSQG